MNINFDLNLFLNYVETKSFNLLCDSQFKDTCRIKIVSIIIKWSDSAKTKSCLRIYEITRQYKLQDLTGCIALALYKCILYMYIHIQYIHLYKPHRFAVKAKSSGKDKDVGITRWRYWRLCGKCDFQLHKRTSPSTWTGMRNNNRWVEEQYIDFLFAAVNKLNNQ